MIKPQGTFEDRGDAASFMLAQLTSQAIYFTARQWLIAEFINSMTEGLSGITEDEKRKLDWSFSEGIGGRVIADLAITNLLGKYGTAEKLLAATVVNAGMLFSGISEKKGPAFGVDISRQVYLPTLASKAGPGGLATAAILGAGFKMYDGWTLNPEASGFGKAYNAWDQLGYSEKLALAKILQPIPFGQELSAASYLRDKAFRDRARINNILGKPLTATLDRASKEVRDIEDSVGAELKPLSVDKTWTAPDNKVKYKLSDQGVSYMESVLMVQKRDIYNRMLNDLVRSPEYLTQNDAGKWDLIKNLKGEVDKDPSFQAARSAAWIDLLKLDKKEKGRFLTLEE